MDILEKYTIKYKEYTNGTHRFEFKIDDALFKAFDDDEIKNAEVLAIIDMNKSHTDTFLKIKINGNVTVECDRCLDDLVIPIKHEDEAKVEYSGTKDEESIKYDIIYVSPEDETINLGQYLYESILLSLPNQKVHSDIKECNPDMMKRFHIVSQEEFDNITSKRQLQTLGENPDFEKLEALKHKLIKDK